MPNPNNTRFVVNDAIALQTFLASKEGATCLDELMARRPALIPNQTTIETVAIQSGVVFGYELAIKTIFEMSLERPDLTDLATNKQMSMEKE